MNTDAPIYPRKEDHWNVKLGTQPFGVVRFRYRYALKVGARVEFRAERGNNGPRWLTGVITEILPGPQRMKIDLA